MKRNSGISLIVLVITIIIIIILAGTVILNLAENNLIASANEARFESNVSEYNSQLVSALTNEQLKDNTFDLSTFDKTTWEGGETLGTIKECIPNITDNDAKKFKIEDGILVYVGGDDTEAIWAAKAGAIVGPQVLGVNAIATENATVDNKPYAYNNPIIPKGFKAINTATATWPAGWNEGLVIEDGNGNQFVWVPVDGTNVPYAKWCTTGIAYNDTSISNDTFPESLNEVTLTTKYQGFYVGRYESGFDYNSGNKRAAIKKETNCTQSTNWSSTRNATYNGYLWNYINYADSKSYAESMDTSYLYDTTKIGTSLMTGLQWDTVMKWIKNSGKSVTDSRTWGNHSNSLSPANVSGYCSLQVSGYSIYWSAKNIYDLAGNLAEWTNEKYLSNSFLRGGFYNNNGWDEYPAACRYQYTPTYGGQDVGFRVALYIK